MSTLEIAVSPLDVVRQTTLRLMTRSALLTRILGRRRSRVASLATVQVLVILALAVFFPVGMFFIGPMILGVAHIAADARYLVLRQRLPKAFVVLSAISAIAIVGLRVLEGLQVVHASVDVWEAAVGAFWMISALAFAARDARARRRALLVGLVLGGLFVVGLTHASAANVVMMHAHNVIGIATWVFLYRKRKAWELLPVAVLAVGVLFVVSGAALPWTYRAGGELAFGTHITAIGRWLAPGATPHVAAGIVISFVLLQAVHYAVWTTWIPQEDLSGEGTLTFRMTMRGLVTDFGAIGCAFVAAIIVGLAGLALFRIHAALSWYVTLSRFHGLLELAVIAFLFVRGEDLSRGGPRPRPS
jgi:hypothetical protein